MAVRILLFTLITLFSLWIGVFCFGDGTIHKVVIFLGYPNILVAFILFIWGLIQLHRKEFKLQGLIPRSRIAQLVIILVTGLLILMEPAEFKIVYDEVILSLSAQLIHFHRLSGLPQQANDYLGSYILMETILDKRPFFFPFLLSLVHDFSGFRYQNAFYLNMGLTFALITFIYVIGKQFSGHRGGLLATLLAGTLPLLSLFSTSGHFEILNLLMISLVVVLSLVYLERPNETRLVPLVYALLLLSQVRYENSLYILPFGLLILLGWKKSKRILLPTPVLLAPLFLILYTLQFRMLQESEFSFFQAGPDGRMDTFSLSYFTENLKSAFNFFFWVGMDMPNSFILSTFGLAAVPAFLFWMAKRRRRILQGNPRETTAAILFLSIALYCLVIGVFNFGMLDRYITHRLGLPILLFFILIAPFILRRFEKEYLVLVLLTGLASTTYIYSGFDKETILSDGVLYVFAVLAFIGGMWWLLKSCPNPRTGILAFPVLFILTVTMPVGHAHRYSQEYQSNDIIMEEIAFLEERKEKEKILFVAGSHYAALLTRTNSTFIDVLNAHPEAAKEHLKRKMYTSIYVCRRFERDNQLNWSLVKEEEYLDPEIFVLETVHEKHLKNNVILEFSRLVDVILPAGALSENQPSLPVDQAE
jgi:hypothetical protein